MDDFKTVISTGSYEARLGLARSLLSQSSERSTAGDDQYSRNLNESALLFVTAILVELAPRRTYSIGSSETRSYIQSTTGPVSTSRVRDSDPSQLTGSVPVSHTKVSELASLIDSLTQLILNKQIRLSDPPTPIPDIADQYLRTSLQALGCTHSHPVNVTKLCHRLAGSLLYSLTKSNEIVPRSRSSSPARANTLVFRLDGLDDNTSSSITKLLNTFPADSALSSPPSSSADSRMSSPRSQSILDLTTEDSATAPSDSPLTSPALSSDDIPSNGNKRTPQGKARNILLDHVRYTSPPRSKEFPRVQSGMTSPSQSSYSSPAPSIRRHLRGRFYSQTENSSLLSLCPSISSTSGSQAGRPVASSSQKGHATISVTPSAKSSMGSFTPVSAKTASGSLRANQSVEPSRAGPLSWLATKLKTDFSTEWHDGDDDWDLIDSEVEELEHESTSSDDGHRRVPLPLPATIRRLSMKRSGNEIPSLCLTQSTFTQPSPLSALFVPPTPPKHRKPSFTSSPPKRSPSPTSPGKQSGNNTSLRKQMLEGRAQQSARSQTIPVPQPITSISSTLQGTSNISMATSPRRCATSPPLSLDPALAALEKKCRLNTKVRCSNCNISGRNFPTARNGETFCSRECRVALKEKRSSALSKGKGKATAADVAVF